ncbi:dihydrofolate reductase family protein [Rapidithrix thailandica]|uniref:Dihydrofolate reductase family protein n=1 Tax=Rapidithrix thailandica TaxID=413964 RepID=A0AAW9SLB5_9BACT
MRKTTLYIAMSLDGYIAQPNDDLRFLSIVQKEGEDYGYAKFNSTVDTVIMGRKTYDWVMKNATEFPHTDKQAFIITRTPKAAIGNTSFYSGSLKTLVLKLKQEKGKTIFIDGGAEVANSLMKEQLIDELIISIIPVCIGEGIRLFKDGRPWTHLQLLESRTFESGLVQLHYQCMKKD